LDVIRNGHADWLGSTFIGEAKQMEIENNKMYRFMYLGEVVGTDANVFANIVDWDGDTDKLDITEVMRGFDWGYGGPDPCAYVEWYYDRKNKRIYALNEFGRPKMNVEEIAFEMKRLNKHNFPIYADSACHELNYQLMQENVNVVDVKKTLILAGIKFLQGLNGIYINKYLTPEIYKEYTEYEYEVDKDDNVTSKLPDYNNHRIDATRYGFSLEIKY
jgi:phage terminase large subunit